VRVRVVGEGKGRRSGVPGVRRGEEEEVEVEVEVAVEREEEEEGRTAEKKQVEVEEGLLLLLFSVEVVEEEVRRGVELGVGVG